MRDHDIFKHPFPIDTTATTKVPTPQPWTETLKEKEVSVLRLTDELVPKGQMPGWCVYEYNLAQSPEIEVLCGGINDKIPDAASIFRQGNLLHFGFQPDPSEYNEVGRKLLLNSLVYITRFAEDRPIARTPSIWLGEKSFPARWRLKSYSHASLPKNVEKKKAWLAKNRGTLAPNKKFKLEPDKDLLKLGVGSDSPAFFATAIAALSGDDADPARRALARYAPDGPGAQGTAAAWQAYVDADGPYLFFSEASGYRWYLDPLAKSRKIPTAELRGVRRATPQRTGDKKPRDTDRRPR